MTTPELETPRLNFRMFTPDDLPALAAIRSDPDVMKYIGSGMLESIDEVQNVLAKLRAHWEQHGFAPWALIDKAKGKLSGWCGLKYLEDAGNEAIKPLRCSIVVAERSNARSHAAQSLQ